MFFSTFLFSLALASIRLAGLLSSGFFDAKPYSHPDYPLSSTKYHHQNPTPSQSHHINSSKVTFCQFSSQITFVDSVSSSVHFVDPLRVVFSSPFQLSIRSALQFTVLDPVSCFSARLCQFSRQITFVDPVSSSVHFVDPLRVVFSSPF